MFVRCASNRQFLKPRSREVYEFGYNKHARYIIGDRRIRDIKYSDMMMFFKYLYEEKHLGISSMRSVYHSLIPVFKMAVRDGIIRTDPLDGVFAEVRKMYELKQNKRSAIPKEQLKALIDFIPSSKKDSRYFNIFLVLMFTGMRVSEMCALTWKDVDFDNDVIHISRSITYTKKRRKQVYKDYSDYQNHIRNKDNSNVSWFEKYLDTAKTVTGNFTACVFR